MTTPDHSVIIKGLFKNKKKRSVKSKHFHCLIYNSCRDDNVVMAGSNEQVDPCLKLTVGFDIMVPDYKDIEKEVVKGLKGKFFSLLLKFDHELKEEIWSGYKIKSC